MVKAAVDLRNDTIDDLSELLQNWIKDSSIVSFTILRGGYSGTNYRIRCSNDEEYAMKICNGYESEEIEEQALATAFLRLNDFKNSCSAYPLLDSTKSLKYVSLTRDNQPVLLLSFLKGIAADYLLENGLMDHDTLLSSVGKTLAMLHSVSGKGFDDVRYFLDKGACFVGKHVKNVYKDLFKSSSVDDYILSHPFIDFYFKHVDNLVENVTITSLPIGILHGDPFLDNVLIDIESGFVGFVDFEDVSRGTLLFDVACFIAGNCFDSNNQLSLSYVSSFLRGYSEYRRLEKEEKDLMIGFIAGVLLCNCW